MRACLSVRALFAAAALVVGSRSGAAQERSGEDDQRERPEVRSLELHGVRSVDEDELLESIATSESECKSLIFFPFCKLSHSRRWWDLEYLDRTELRRDVLRIKVFYWKRGFREAEVDTTVTGRGGGAVDVAFRITEGPPTRVRAVRVVRPDTVLTDDQVERLVTLRAGEPFDLLELDSTIVAMRTVLEDKGYADARFDTATTVDTASRVADVRITIDPRWQARVGEIRIAGNRGVSDRTIRNSLSFEVGDLYRLRELSASQRRLYESGLFERASIVVPSAGDSLKIVQISVNEAPPRLARVAGGFSTFDFVQVDGRYRVNNFFGGARRLDITGAVGNLFSRQLSGTDVGGLLIFQDVADDLDIDADPFFKPTYQASIDFTQPWFFSPRNSAGLGAFAHRRQAPGVFVDRGLGGVASLTREVLERFPVSALYRYEVTRVEAGDVYFCVNYGVCDPQTIDALRARQKLSPFALTANINRQNDPLTPSRGYNAQATLEHASAFTLSSFRYNSIFVDGAAYRPIRSGMVLAAHARVGYVYPLKSTRIATRAGDEFTGQILHPRKRFYAGGARSVRGVGENQLGPRVLTIPPSKLAAICPDLSGDAVTECQLTRTTEDGETLADRDFTPRPLGGRALIEGSAELRFPIWEAIHGAVFLDGALLGQGSLESATKGAGALTPGIGVRYHSPVGPIRVDLGLNPSLPENLPVITQVPTADGFRIVQLDDRWRYNPTGGRGGLTGLMRRLTLHLSIGEAY